MAGAVISARLWLGLKIIMNIDIMTFIVETTSVMRFETLSI